LQTNTTEPRTDGRKYLWSGIGSTVKLQHASGRVQSEQVEADLETGTAVAIHHGVQILQGDNSSSRPALFKRCSIHIW
jgi:hypothetical protein